jgi:hypothetical protein
MASRNAALKLAAALLTKENLPIAEKIAQQHLDAAMEKKDTPRVLELSTVIKLIADVKAEK